MARLCERPGCSAPASCSYGIDTPGLRVWIGALEGSIEGRLGPRVGALCRRHADAMVVPRGWRVDDRRAPGATQAGRPSQSDARLPVAAPALATGTGQAEGRADADAAAGRPMLRRIRRRRPAAPQSEQLVLLGLEADPVAESPSGPVTPPPITPSEPSAQPGAASRSDSPPEVDDDVETGTGAASAMSVDAVVTPVSEPQPEPGVAADSSASDEAPVSPWRPVFDQSDDLGGLLSARGPLLARAFGRHSKPSPRKDGPAVSEDDAAG